MSVEPPAPSACPRRGRKSLFWRIYGNGLLQLGAVAVALLIAGRLTAQRNPFGAGLLRVQRYLNAELLPLLDSPAQLQARVASAATAFDADVAIHGPDGRLLAAAGSQVAPCEAPWPSTLRLRRRERGQHRLEAPLGSPASACVVAHFGWGTNPWRVVAALLLVLVALALASLPLARSIAAPLERLTDSARRLGEGDLAARSELERRDEIGELGRTLDRMAARLQILVTREKELLANVSHELRTPLARLRLALELAEEEGEPAALRELLQGMGGDLTELEGLVEEVLRSARLDLAAVRGGDGTLPLKVSHVDLAALVEQAAQRFVSRHPEHRLRTELRSDLEGLHGDAALLRRALDNLLDNAARYSDAQSGPVELEALAGKELLRVEVRDRGIGLRVGEAARVFEPFWRSDRSRARATGGLGLGLALCRSIIAAHGGTVGAEPRAGGGATFWIELPLGGGIQRVG